MVLSGVMLMDVVIMLRVMLVYFVNFYVWVFGVWLVRLCGILLVDC